MDRWTLITGASSGIGFELAKLFGADGWNLVLVARDEGRLSALASDMERQHRVLTRVVPADLSKPDAAQELFSAVRDLEISALVNNAGFGRYGPFSDLPWSEAAGMVQVNITALMHLTHLFLPSMLSRRKGMILNVGSVAAFQPGPTMGVYYASKAFVYSFSYALAVELKGTGVTVTLLSPGTTKTNFFARARVHMSRPLPVMEARDVALAGYRAALKGRRTATPGWLNKVASVLSPCMPSGLTAGIVAKVHRR